MTDRLRLGDMLVAARLVTEQQVEEALEAQRELGLRLGETLVQLGYVDEQQMMQVLSNQLTIPWVNLYHVDFSRELLDMVPADVAEEHSLVPVYVRQVRKEGDTLYVAMDDPLNTEALQVVSDRCGLPVKPMVASPTDIADAIRVYYLGLPPLGGEEDAEEQVLVVEDEEPAPRAEAAETRAAVQPSMKPPARGTAAAFRTLTLLDGTVVRLPAPEGATAAPEETKERGLTTRDLIHALQAKAAGEDVRDVLTEDDWESLFATLLAVLLRKGLIADWEFVTEWKKHRKNQS